jgi:epsin
MAEIAQMTFDSHDFLDVMDMLDRRMNDRGKMWRHVYKVVAVGTLLTFLQALQVFDYCVRSGSENVVRWGKDNLYVVKSLREFQYVDDDGVDQGSNSTFLRYES